MSKQIKVTLDDDLAEELAELAQRQDRPMARIVRHAVFWYLNEQRREVGA